MKKSESEIQNEVRVKAAKYGARMWRNNLGVAFRKDGTPVRYGLCNSSSGLNSEYKSSDLIGITPVFITKEMVGKTLGVFTSYEVKKEGWHYSNKPREIAQKEWIDKIISLGGIADFISDAEQAWGDFNETV